MEIMLELVRATQGGDAHGLRFGAQEYLLRTPGGRYENTTLHWTDELRADFVALSSPSCAPARVQRVGEQMREFVGPGIWARVEADIERARALGEAIRLTVRSAAAELYLLPWELLALESTGQHVGELPDVLIRYAWPETRTVGTLDGHPGARLLMAWSAAGGAVPSSEHERALTQACADNPAIGFESDRDVLANASWSALRERLAHAESTGASVTGLHVLCHGAERGGSPGLIWDGEQTDEAWISAANLRQLLESFKSSLRLVVLSACHSSDAGAPGNHLGSVAQAVHRIGIPWVIGSRYSLSKRASVAFVDAFYARLGSGARGVESAFLAARDDLLSPDPTHGHWMGFQLYARPERAHEAVESVQRAPEPSIDDTSTEASVTEPGRALDHPSVAIESLVDELISWLSKLRKAPEGSEIRAELTGKIDAHVEAIKTRFRPAEDSIVAGAALHKVIGVGNFGTVWEAIDTETGERVAVKIFRLERLALGQMLARFRRSIRAMRLLGERKRLDQKRDPRGAIVSFRRVDETALAFSMDLMMGGNIEEVDRLGWTLERKREVMLSVAAAVMYSHENGVIHRDVKPANIVLDDRGEPVLTDFDIADIRWATSLSTSVDAGLGTPIFAAPEQLEDPDAANERADIYSLGRVLYYLLLERSPGYQVERDPSLSNLEGHPPALVEIVRRATQYDQARRFASVREFIDALENSHTGAAAWWARWTRAKRWTRRHWAPLVIALAVLLGAVGFAVYQQGIAAQETAAREEAERLRAEADRQSRIAREQSELAEEATANLSRLSGDLRDIERQKAENARAINAEQRKLKSLRDARDRAVAGSPLRARLARDIADVEAELQALRVIEIQLAADLERIGAELAEARAVADQRARANDDHSAP